jgi:hypothetical protein
MKKTLILSLVPQKEGNSRNEAERIAATYQCKKWEEKESQGRFLRKSTSNLKAAKGCRAILQNSFFLLVCLLITDCEISNFVFGEGNSYSRRLSQYHNTVAMILYVI